MTNMILFVVSTVVFAIFNIAGLAGVGNEVRRTFVEMPITLVKSAVAIDSTNDIDFDAYFSSNVLEDNINNYLSKSLKDKVPSYKIGFTYFNYKENGQFDFDTLGKPKYVQIQFICKYFLDYQIDEHLTFDARRV